ncbi:MAG: C1 family peptidase [Deferrisomatales bacterium]
MPTREIQDHVFDARPDCIDYRDRPYLPPLVSLPERHPDPEVMVRHLPDYAHTRKLVLNQGREGACTGFGLAAVVNYLLYRQHPGAEPSPEAPRPIATVSPRMLFHMARVYDEWPGEDYEGSSCRGAMKGWHRHGVCTEAHWPYRARAGRPREGWQSDAARRPLGAYYRVDKDSISDLQAAIHEVGAVYASAAVHPGWFLGTEATLPVIPLVAGATGGHAFALIGYTPEGFIMQNSWGTRWGYHGFAVLPYEDWVQHGSDAWVAVLGAPMTVATQPRARSSMSLGAVAAGKAAWSWSSVRTTRGYRYQNEGVQPLGESEAYEHTLVLGNDGRPLNRFIDLPDAAAAVQEVAYDLPLAWLREHGATKLAVYARGGLNDEEASIRRIRVMAPYFRANGIYPLFITWRTGFGESIAAILEDAVGKFFKPSEEQPARGWAAELKNRLKEARDRSVEVACEHLLVKPVWMQMKQNAAAAAGRSADAGLTRLAHHLAALHKELPGLEVHLLGHSAGSLAHGHLLDRLAGKHLGVASVSLYAPACSVPFALDHYAEAVEKRQILDRRALFVDLLSDERERADSVGPYGKSLLFLVSRALEDLHKMPLLGMEAAWNPQVERRGERDLWNRKTEASVDQWRAFAAGGAQVRVHGRDRAKVSDGQGLISLAHGSFDKDVEVVGQTLERIRGAALKVPVENLRGF